MICGGAPLAVRYAVAALLATTLLCVGFADSVSKHHSQDHYSRVLARTKWVNSAPGAPGQFHRHRRRLRRRRHRRRRRRRRLRTSAALVAITDAPGGTAPGAALRRTGGSSSATARGGWLMRQSSREAIAPKMPASPE